MNVDLADGFLQIPNAILDAGTLKTHDLVVVFVLARFNPSFPSLATISKLSGLSIPSVKRAIRRLEKLRIIVVTRSIGRSNQYALCWWKTGVYRTRVVDEPGSIGPPTGVCVTRVPGSIGPPNNTKGIILNNKSAIAEKNPAPPKPEIVDCPDKLKALVEGVTKRLMG